MFASPNSRPSRRRRAGLGIAGVMSAVALVLTGCSNGGDSPGSSSDEGPQVLTVASTVPPVSLDPYLQNVDPQNNWFINLAYDSLIRISPEGELIPDLATEWEFLDDSNTQFELTLREGVTFSDGEEMTPESVVASLEYARASGVNAPTYWDSLETITISGENTILFESSSPNPALPSMLTNRVLLGSIISPAGLEDPEALKSNTYGAGPYILDTERTVANDTYVYTPNENYWDQERIAWDEVRIMVVANSAAALQAVQNGEADLTRGDAATYEAATAAGLHVELVGLGLLGVNFVDRAGEVLPELADVRVRQALNYAIDRESIATAAFGDTATAGAQLALPDTLGYEAEINEAYPYDPDRARELLEEAGVENLAFSVGVDQTSPIADILMQAVVQNWADVGVTANLEVYSDKGQAVSDILAKKFPVTYFGYGQLTPFTVMNSFYGGANQYNPFEVRDPELDALRQAALEAPADEQQEAIAAVYEYATVDLAWTGTILHSSYPYISDASTITGTEHVPTAGTADIAWFVVPAN